MGGRRWIQSFLVFLGEATPTMGTKDTIMDITEFVSVQIFQKETIMEEKKRDAKSQITQGELGAILPVTVTVEMLWLLINTEETPGPIRLVEAIVDNLKPIYQIIRCSINYCQKYYSINYCKNIQNKYGTLSQGPI